MAAIILRFLHLAQAGIAGYGLYVSSISITNLQKYEKRTKQAAKYSQSAADQLYKTRTTQSAGAVAILISLLTSLYLAFGSGYPSSSKLTLTLANAGMALIVRTYMLDFWRSSAKVPFVKGYNEAISRTGEVMDVLITLAVSWGVLGLAWASATVLMRREARL
ncbi:hypothetical protein EV356DRAFT_535905 [Viridothelium virens]|uniref:DUF1772-domain-containing protein n=1 Tax=Viridothelium virens TaxID=1048519 RepID=A0A6A6GZM8_VIRVR|nr:hypothetical protein EV356DRAFT_535905 [Viridothelium virens]